VRVLAGVTDRSPLPPPHRSTSPTFRHAVASFDPTATSVLLWTRVSAELDEVRWELATDPELRELVASGSAPIAADADQTVVVDADGLEPATTYWYRFHAGGATSPIGRTRTLPDGPVDAFALATVCCARYSVAPLGVYRAIAEREVDLVVHLGDYIYEDDGAKGPRPHDPPRTATTLDDYRRRIAQIRADPDAQAMHLRHPMVAIWDDHDLADNAWRDGAKAHDPDEHGPWTDRVAAAARARAEWLPARLLDPDDPTATWRSLEIGDLARLLLLDTRFHGRDRHAGDDGTPDLEDPARSLLGDEQRSWLRQRLADEPRAWTLLASGVVVDEITLPWPRGLRWANALLPNGYAVLDGEVMHDDQWDGFPEERRRLAGWLRELSEAGSRSIILSGDVHSSWGFEGPRLDGQPVAVEVTAPAAASQAMARARVPGVRRFVSRQARALEHVAYAELSERGYATVELTERDATLAWWHVHPWAQDPAQRETLGARFRTRHDAWPPCLEPVPDGERGRRTATREGPGHLGPRHHPGGLPPRPDDLRRLRRRRNARLVVEIAAPAAIAVVLAVARAVLGRPAHPRPRSGSPVR
jgi:alkaline phosphatase D